MIDRSINQLNELVSQSSSPNLWLEVHKVLHEVIVHEFLLVVLAPLHISTSVFFINVPLPLGRIVKHIVFSSFATWETYHSIYTAWTTGRRHCHVIASLVLKILMQRLVFYREPKVNPCLSFASHMVFLVKVIRVLNSETFLLRQFSLAKALILGQNVFLCTRSHTFRMPRVVDGI